ncbi:hypothetical protein [Hymenobacter jejuensis]|uniref:Lipoprotein n=1 Tax=Hymenobacter jejuensis TaxID=2502781 RepID=A0A5B8A467_9BACT|nr:hypothetical protein [Hymenobacter jejuensis]QDA62204.1 hypothetical protein FHG12_19805 [Hymenobacter jejuensis]
MAKYLALCFLFFASCQAHDEKANKLPIEKAYVESKTKLTSFVIIPSGGYKSLSIKELDEVDSLLKACIIEFNHLQEEEMEKMAKAYPAIPVRKENYVIDLSTYKKQLVIWTNERGEKHVWVNCFCDDKPYWKERIVEVTDGGNCYFNVKLNLTKRSWYSMDANGVA